VEIDLPDVHAEVTEAFEAYEKALTGNDVETLDRLFWTSERVVRYGATECLYGHEEILAFRRARPSKGLDRRLTRTVITTFGRDFATACTEFAREGEGRVGRQTQTWARLPEGWRIVAAHVSLMEA
jgi:hypothetical protein